MVARWAPAALVAPPPFQSAWAAAAARPPGLAVLLPVLLNLLLVLLVLLVLLLLVLRLVGCDVGGAIQLLQLAQTH